MDNDDKESELDKSKSVDDSMEASGEESDNGDGLPDDGQEIDPLEARSEEEEADSDDKDFISASEQTDEDESEDGEGDDNEEPGDTSDDNVSDAMSDEPADNKIGRKRAMQLLADDTDED